MSASDLDTMTEKDDLVQLHASSGNNLTSSSENEHKAIEACTTQKRKRKMQRVKNKKSEEREDGRRGIVITREESSRSARIAKKRGPKKRRRPSTSDRSDGSSENCDGSESDGSTKTSEYTESNGEGESGGLKMRKGNRGVKIRKCASENRGSPASRKKISKGNHCDKRTKMYYASHPAGNKSYDKQQGDVPNIVSRNPFQQNYEQKPRNNTDDPVPLSDEERERNDTHDRGNAFDKCKCFTLQEDILFELKENTKMLKENSKQLEAYDQHIEDNKKQLSKILKYIGYVQKDVYYCISRLRDMKSALGKNDRCCYQSRNQGRNNYPYSQPHLSSSSSFPRYDSNVSYEPVFSGGSHSYGL